MHELCGSVHRGIWGESFIRLIENENEWLVDGQ